jgi:hypothetical protein
MHHPPGETFPPLFHRTYCHQSEKKAVTDRTLNDAGRSVNENQDRGTRLQIQDKDDNEGMEIETNPYRYREFLKEN